MKPHQVKLNSPGLLSLIRSHFETIEDHRANNKGIHLTDALMSGLGVFSLKFPSLLQFEKKIRGSDRPSNILNLFGVSQVPSDTQMRSILDEVSPQNIKGLFKKIFSALQRQKKLGPYTFLTHHGHPTYYVAVDGTNYFHSKKVHGDCCLVKKHRDGTKSYHHQMLAAAITSPHLKTVIPLAPEAVVRQDGQEKNDCEINAFKRWVANFRKDHPKLNVVIGGDALFATGTCIKLLKQENMGFILSVKQGSHKAMFRFIDGSEKRGFLKHHKTEEVIGDKVKKKITKEYCYRNQVPLSQKDSFDLDVNFVRCVETTEWTTMKGEKKTKVQKFSWITDIPLNKGNIEKVAKGGRSRWHIENEVFNTLKNLGYNLEHNYGHGNKFLSEVFSLLMMSAFLVDQVLEMSCPTFKKILKLLERKSYIWSKLRFYYQEVTIKGWDFLWGIFILSSEKPPLVLDTS